MRRLNAALVLRTIRNNHLISRAELARETGLSKPTVNDVVEQLIRGGFVLERPNNGELRPPRPGRRGRALQFRADFAHVIGIDIGANKVVVLAADLAGRIVASERRQAHGAAGASVMLSKVRGAVSSVLARAGIRRQSVQAVGVGTPGIVDPATGKVTLAPQLGGWESMRLGHRLGRSFSCPVLVENEVRLAILAERWRGAAHGVPDALYVQVGYGIGAGVLVRGEIYRGAHGAAGEIGLLPLQVSEERVGSSDRLGPFEWGAGGSAYARLGGRAARGRGGRLLRELAGGDPDLVDAEIVFEALRRGDHLAESIVDELVGRLAHGIAAAVVLLDPGLVIIGGGLSQAGSDLLDRLERVVGDLVPVPSRLVLSTLGDESVALGGVRLALEHVDDRLFELSTAVAG